MRTAVISLALAISSIASCFLMGYSYAVSTLLFIAFNLLTAIIIFTSLKVAIKGLFSKGVNKIARSLCVVAIFINTLSVYIYVGMNSISGIV